MCQVLFFYELLKNLLNRFVHSILWILKQIKKFNWMDICMFQRQSKHP